MNRLDYLQPPPLLLSSEFSITCWNTLLEIVWQTEDTKSNFQMDTSAGQQQ